MTQRLFLIVIFFLLVLQNGMIVAETIRINAGSNQDYTDRNGNVWMKDDKEYHAGQRGSIEWSTSDGIDNTRDDALYQTERFIREDSLKYSIPVPKPGDYEVRLHWAENFRGAQGPNLRIFHVAIEGKMEMPNVDIFKEAGDGFRALSKAARVVVSGPSIEIEFSKVLQVSCSNAVV